MKRTICALAAIALTLTSPALAGSTPGPAHCVEAVISTCFDGDTCTAQVRPWRPGIILEEKVRGRGYNTAELQKGPCRAVGKAARDQLNSLVKGRKVSLCDIRFESLYGRVLARITVDGVDVATSMIAAGLAVPYEGEEKAGTWCPAK